MDRRLFLVRSGAALGSAVLASAKGAYAASAVRDDDLSNWRSVRALFDADPAVAHFAGFFLASHPRPVREAIARYRAELDRNPMGCWLERHQEREAAVAAAAAAYMGVEAEDVALTDSTTMGLGLVYTALDLGEGDEVLTTDHDHYSTTTALDFGARRSGVRIVRAPLYAKCRTAGIEEMVESIVSRLTPRTRVVALTWVHSKTGLKLPVRAIADAIAERTRDRAPARRPILCLDGVHGLGAVPGKPAELGCDVFVAGTHKWMFAPRGTGIVWARPEVWERIAPTIPPFGSHAEPGSLHTPGGFHSFEHRWAVDEAFRLHERIGTERVYGRIRALNAELLDGLAGMAHVTLHTPRDQRLVAGIVCFEIDGLSTGQAVERLAKERIVASGAPYRPSYVRLSAGLLNDESEVERALAAVRSLA